MATPKQKEARDRLATHVIAACEVAVALVLGAMTYHLSNENALLERRAAALGEARTAPRMDVQYMTARHLDSLRDFAKRHAYLLQRNGISEDWERAGNGGRLVVLQVTNRGGSDAEEVSVVVEQVTPGPTGKGVLSPSYVHGHGGDPSSLRLGSIPRGETRLTPVFRLNDAKIDQPGWTHQLDGLAYVPRAVEFVDAVTRRHYSVNVRDMLDCEFGLNGDLAIRG